MPDKTNATTNLMNKPVGTKRVNSQNSIQLNTGSKRPKQDNKLPHTSTDLNQTKELEQQSLNKQQNSQKNRSDKLGHQQSCGIPCK